MLESRRSSITTEPPGEIGYPANSRSPHDLPQASDGSILPESQQVSEAGSSESAASGSERRRNRGLKDLDLSERPASLGPGRSSNSSESSLGPAGVSPTASTSGAGALVASQGLQQGQYMVALTSSSTFSS